MGHGWGWEVNDDVLFPLGFFLGCAVMVFVGYCSNGFNYQAYGYADGCRDGSRGHSQVVTVEGVRKCVPHPEAIRMRAP